MAYTPNPVDATQPIDSVFASTAAAEFRALKAYVQTIVAGAVLGNQTPGMIVPFAGAGVPPAGWLECNGSLQSRVTFSGLYTALVNLNALTTEAIWATGYYGYASTGDTVNNFRLPDLRGLFIRGWNNGRADIWSDPGRNPGQFQGATEVFDNGGNAGVIIQPWTGNLTTKDYNSATPVTAYGAVTPGSTSSAALQAGGVRPTNIALRYCIKT